MTGLSEICLLRATRFNTGAEVCLLNCLDSHHDKLYIVVVGFSSRVRSLSSYAWLIYFRINPILALSILVIIF